MNSIPVYIEPKDLYVTVGIVSIEIPLDAKNFEFNDVEKYVNKISGCLSHLKGVNFILFPEFSYSEKLEDIFRTFSDENNAIIIGGSGVDKSGEDWYCYSPVFIPGEKQFKKVYKKMITATETSLSADRIHDYPGEVTRDFTLIVDERQISFAVYVCNDFLLDLNRKDYASIYFVPQYERNAGIFRGDAYRVSTKDPSFVLGCNIVSSGFRTIGTGSCNSTVINGLATHGFRDKEYQDAGQVAYYNKAILYDVNNQCVLKFQLNLGDPRSTAHTFAQTLNVIPTKKIDL